jgi:transglutaminase-like putative cysteine protease
MPIDILNSYITDGVAFGRCGEFALLYNGLCLTNGYKTRLVLDESTPSPPNGDHVWLEVWTENRWVHVDPTEQRFDEPKMYAVDWNKEVNNVVAITKDSSGNMVVVDVTKTYE